MKKFYSVLLLLFSLINSIWGQVCTPDVSITASGVYPDQPDTAYVDQSYDFSFQILSIKDTAVVYGGIPLTATIDSVKVNAVIGLPASFDYACNPSSCTFTYKAVGCINLKGNPIESQAGVYDIKIATTAYAKAGILRLPVPDTTEGYQLVIQGDGSASIYDHDSQNVQVYPNPSSNGQFMVVAQGKIEEYNVRDIQGKALRFQSKWSSNKLALNLSDTPSGVYVLHMVIDGKYLTKKIVH